MINKKKKKNIGFILALLVFPFPILANSNQEFTADFFESFSPKNALDAVKNIPGFTLNLGKSLRGLAGGGGNVLVDSVRVSSKSGGLEEVLTRIPFAQIERIEIIRGSSKVTDANAQSIVANIIRKQVAAAGQIAFNLHYNAGNYWFPSAEASYASQLGEWQSNVKVNVIAQKTPQNSEYISAYNDDSHNTIKREDKDTKLNEAFISAELGNGKSENAMQITMRAGQSQYRPKLVRNIYQHNAPLYKFSNDRNSIYQTAELGVDKRSAFDGWQWRTIGLVNFTHWTIDRHSETDYFIEKNSEQYDFQRNKWETILRNSFTYQSDNSITQFGLELSYNDINVNTQYEKTDMLGKTAKVFLPAAIVDVDEVRAEGFVSQQWQWKNGVSLLAGTALEYSKITATGDSHSKQNFTFLKPSLVLGYEIQEDWTSQLRFERTVNQLDFKLFAAQSDADNGRDQAGNPSLKPDSYYQLSITNDVQFNQHSALQISLFHQWYQDVLEYQQTPSSAQLLTNSGDATILGAQISLSYALSDLVPGGLITISWKEQKSDYYDPIINRKRRLTNENTPDGNIAFRQDLHQKHFSWGVSFQAKQYNKRYFVKELALSEQSERWLAFVEYRGFSFADIKLSLDKIGSLKNSEQRIFFRTNRDGSTNLTTQINREDPLQIQLSLYKSF